MSIRERGDAGKEDVMKRVKKGFARHYKQGAGEDARRMELTALADGSMRVVVADDAHGNAVYFDLPVHAVEALGITAALEDVPEPWQVLRCAVLDAAGTITSEPGERIHITERGWREAAKTLGIEPESSSARSEAL